MKVLNYTPLIDNTELKYLRKCIDSKWLSSSGPLVKKFENKIKKFTGSKYAVACSNGTTALQLAIRLLNPSYGDEILLPSLTFIASANSVIYNNCNPVFLDSDNNYNLDLLKLKIFLKKNTYLKNGFTYNKKTKRKILALISVSVWGSSSDLFEIKKILKSKNIYLLEDAAEGLGSYCVSNKKKKHLGTFGTLGCISFNLNKIITTGGGGIILTDNKRLALKAKYLSLQAKDNPLKWIHNEVGYNFGLSNLHAAIGLAQLLKLKKIIKNKKKIYKSYKEGIKNNKNYEIFSPPKYISSNYWMNVLIIKNKNINLKKLYNKFISKNIEVKYVWFPCHLQKQFKKYQNFNIKNSLKLVSNSLLLPSSSNLSKKEINSILKVLK